MTYFGPCIRGEKTCLHELAAGWINPPDLCPTCTVRFVTGVEWAAGRQLEWHLDYLARSTQRREA